MTTIEKIHRLAYATGWTKEDKTRADGTPHVEWYHESDRRPHANPFDYFADANAVATAMTLIHFGNERKWAENLCRIIHGDFNNHFTIAMLKATPAQLAESIWVTVGLWERETKEFAEDSLDKSALDDVIKRIKGEAIEVPNPTVRIAYAEGCQTLLGVMQLAVNGTWTHVKVESEPIRDQSEKSYIHAIGDTFNKLSNQMMKIRSDMELSEFQAAHPYYKIEKR